MKQLKFIFTLFVAVAMMCACSDDDDVNKNAWGDSYARFIRSAMTVNATDGTAEVVLQCRNSSWNLTMGEGAIVTAATPSQGNATTESLEFVKVTLTCSANPNTESRTQTLFLTDAAGVTSELEITQDPAGLVRIEVNTNQTYQPVVGFGGMYNPVIWTGSNVPSSAEMDKMYAPDGLGYTILRLMIYPNEENWSADVEGAKQAQAHGATIFACPWDCTDALSDKVSYNGNEVKHLKPENYGAYADHLIKYVKYMRDNGVDIYAISVQNEPDMEFTYWTPQEVVNFLKQEGARIRQEAGVKLMAPESCGLSPEYTDPVINDSEAFAQTDIIAGHLYQGFIDEDGGYVQNRHKYITELYGRINGKTWWMTEHLFNDGENEEDPALWQFQTWDYAFSHLAKEIHMCMEGYCSAYVYWYLKRFYGLMGDTDQRSPVGNGEITKNGYILAHYAQYASGTTRVEASTASGTLKPTAYVDTQGNVTLVILNESERAQTVFIPLDSNSPTAIETNEGNNMTPISVNKLDGGVSLSISGKSIVSVRL